MDFEKFNKIPRLSRDIVITEKIDGTNAQIYIIPKDIYCSEMITISVDMNEIEEFKNQYCLYKKDDILIFAGSRRKWLDISSKGDNFGFAKWVEANADELLKLGEGRHYGEWHGQGIQRNYGLTEKRFALFNVKKWENAEVRPKCCEIVPVLYRGMFDTEMIGNTLMTLKENGSKIAPGFMNPEGIVIYHTASAKLFKKTIHDDQGKNEKDKISS